jgi:penicillin-insensitive murein endopeptidase
MGRGPSLLDERLGRLARIAQGLLVVATLATATGCLAAPTPLAPGRSGSIGLPHHGVQTGAEELPKSGAGYVRFRPHSPNYWGNPRLVQAIEAAALDVQRARPDTPPLVVGDLSARYGGKIPGHNSHRTGRDVDLLWYFTTPAGVPVTAPGFINVESDGLAKLSDDRYLLLDIDRTWLLFKSLLKHTNVQFLFVSRDVEGLLIDHALARESDLRVLWHAETVMLQPGDSAPHADHVHVRIACTSDEAVRGCEGGGPRWEWLEPLPVLSTPTDTLVQRIASEDPFELEQLPEPTPAQAMSEGT